MITSGVSSFDITPAKPLPLQGHYCPEPALDVFSPLVGRAIAFSGGKSTIILITLDVIGVEKASTERIRRKINQRIQIPANHVMVAASHTHCAPATLSRVRPEPDARWLTMIEDKSVEAACQAVTNLAPVRLAIGQASACFGINRRGLGNTLPAHPGGVVDRRVRVLCVDHMNGTPLASLFHFSCHPVAMHGSKRRISPDYPGPARQLIERQCGGVAMFLPGCFGNIRPNIVDLEGHFCSATESQVIALGQELGRAVCLARRRSASIPDDAVAASIKKIRYHYGSPPAQRQLDSWAQDRLGYECESWANRLKSMIATNNLPNDIVSEIQTMHIGSLELIGIGGEPTQEIGFSIERQSDREDVWAMGYCNDMVGYLCTERHKDEGGYEPTAYRYFDQPAAFYHEEQTIIDCVFNKATTPPLARMQMALDG